VFKYLGITECGITLNHRLGLLPLQNPDQKLDIVSIVPQSWA